MMHSVFLALGFAAAFAMKRSEERRLGYRKQPGYQFVSVGALAGALIGSKLGMILYLEPSEWLSSVQSGALFAFDGKTVIGGLAGGWLGVELAKKLVGITSSTGDAFAVAIPLGQAIGRLGCFAAECCYGAPTSLPWAVLQAGALRHPHQLYEAACDAIASAVLFAIRKQPRPAGRLFRLSMLSYALIRIGLEPWRGDSAVRWFGVPAPTVFCVLAVLLIGWSLRTPKLERAAS